MRFDEQEYEETVDLKAVLAEVLRKWVILLAAVVLGAALLGFFKFASPVEYEVDEEAVATAQAAVDATQKAINDSITERQMNENTISADREKISADEQFTDELREYVQTMETNLNTLKVGINEARAMLSDPDATTSDTSQAIFSLHELINEVTGLNERLIDMMDRIKTVEAEIISLKTEIDNLTNRNLQIDTSITELENTLSLQGEELAAAQQGTVKGGSVVTFALLGGLLGAVLVVGYVFIRYMFDKTLKSSSDIKDPYGVPILGELRSRRARAHKGFARKLDNMAGDIQTFPDEKRVYEFAAAGVEAAVRAPVSIAVTGTVDLSTLGEVAENIKAFLPEGYAVSPKENPAYSADFLSEIRDYSVLWVECKGVSMKDEIHKLAELLARNGVNVIGAVIK